MPKTKDAAENAAEEITDVAPAGDAETAGNGHSEAPKAAGQGFARIMLKDPVSGEELPRAALIAKLYAEGTPEGVEPKVTAGNRGQIVKYLEQAVGHKTSFQTVYQATSEKGPKGEGGGGARGKQIDWDGTQRYQSEVIRELLKGDPENGVPGLSRQGVVRAFKDRGYEIAYGSVFGISKRLKDQGVDITKETPTKTSAATPEGGEAGAAAEGPAFQDESASDEDALP